MMISFIGSIIVLDFISKFHCLTIMRSNSKRFPSSFPEDLGFYAHWEVRIFAHPRKVAIMMPISLHFQPYCSMNNAALSFSQSPSS